MNTPKKVVISVIVGFVWFSVVSWFPDPDARDFVRTFFGCVLCWFLYRRANWARWTIGVLSLLAVLASIPLLLSGNVSIARAILVLVVVIFYGYAAFVLLSGKYVAPYFTPSGRDDHA